MFESGDHRQLVQLFVVTCFGLGRWDISDRLEEALVVEPVDPFEGSELHGFSVTPRSASVDHLRFEQTIDGLGQGVVVAVADATDRGLDTGFGQALGVADGNVLAPPIAMVNELIRPHWPAVMERLNLISATRESSAIVPAAVESIGKHHERRVARIPCVFCRADLLYGSLFAERGKRRPAYDWRASAIASVSMYWRKRVILPSFTVQTCA